MSWSYSLRSEGSAFQQLRITVAHSLSSQVEMSSLAY